MIEGLSASCLLILMLLTSITLKAMELRIERIKALQKGFDTLVDERETMAFTRVTGGYKKTNRTPPSV